MSENNGAAMIEVLGGQKGQDLDDFQVLLPVHQLRTIQQIQKDENEHNVDHIRCKSSGEASIWIQRSNFNDLGHVLLLQIL